MTRNNVQKATETLEKMLDKLNELDDICSRFPRLKDDANYIEGYICSMIGDLEEMKIDLTICD